MALESFRPKTKPEVAVNTKRWRQKLRSQLKVYSGQERCSCFSPYCCRPHAWFLLNGDEICDIIEGFGRDLHPGCLLNFTLTTPSLC